MWPVGVRDCSVQRRHQKLIEEAPSPALTVEQDAEIHTSAARLMAAIGYTNAGTVEFLYDPVDARFVFMEVNARLQVEHPITEVTTGLDLVKLQLHVRGGRAARRSAAYTDWPRHRGSAQRGGQRSQLRARSGRDRAAPLSGWAGVANRHGLRGGRHDRRRVRLR